jgi:CRISPR-associated protein Csb1
MTTGVSVSSGQSGLLETLYGQDRVVITASLELTNGRFLQPTGFPDIGACIYRDKEGRRWCLVESEQSMSNRLEAVCMKDPGVWVDELKGLPVIAVRDPERDLLTTNLCEPHRIASSYVLDGKFKGGKTMKALFEEKLGLKNGGDSWPLGKRAELEKLVFALDPAALLHGFQFVQWGFVGLRQTRLLHGRLEAELADDAEVHYGMLKWDAIEPESTREERANKGQSIAAKSRIVPRDVIATFDVDMLGLKSLVLPDDQKKFLLGLALWKIGAFLANKPSFDPRSRQTLPSLRLRADCYLRCRSIKWEGDSRADVTTADDLIKALPQMPDFSGLVKEVLSGDGDGSNSSGSVTSGDGEKLYEDLLLEVTYEPKKRKKGKTSAIASQQTVESDEEEAEDEQE